MAEAMTYDLETFQTVTSSEDNGRLYLTFSKDNTSRRVTGLQKLVQKYVLTFLTPKGSMSMHPERGTDFMNAFMKGGLQTRSGILSEFSFANLDTVQQIQSQELDDDPDEEKLRRAVLLDYAVDFNTGILYFKVQLITAAGTEAVLIMPTK